MSPDPHRIRRLISLGALTAGVATMVGVLILPATAGAASNHASTMVKVEKSTAWGSILENGNGKTVYRLAADSKNKSRCSGACAKIWPPVLLAPGQKHPSGISGLGDFRRSNGTHQVTFKGEPLYTFVGDKAPGQITGNGADQWGKWWVVNPAHPLAIPHEVSTAGTPPTTGSSSPGTTSPSTSTTTPSSSTKKSSTSTTKAPTSGGGSSSSTTQPPVTPTTQPPAPPTTQPPATTTTTVPKTTTTTTSGGGIAY
jgi:predicted lipoprotein with Yx(FWY)xxD motif